MTKLNQHIAARELRKSGWSLRQIASELGVSKGSVSIWVQDIELTPQQVFSLTKQNPATKGYKGVRSRGNSERARDRRRLYQERGHQLVHTDQRLAQLAMIYWGEGSKNKNSFTVSNSDPHLIKMVFTLTTDLFEVPSESWTLTLGLHASHELTVQAIETYWLNLLDLPRSALRRHSIDNRPRSATRAPKYKYPYGICRLSLGRTDIVQTVYGAIQELANFSKPEWLG